MIMKILTICLCIMLIISLFAFFNDKPTPSFEQFLNQLEGSKRFSTDWVQQVTIPIDNIESDIFKGIVNFINTFILTPVRAVLVVCTMVVNVFAFIIDYYTLYFA